MISYLSKFLLLAGLATTSAQCSRKTLEVTLWDSFGDGWQDAWWSLTDPAGSVSKDQATCTENAFVIEVDPCDHSPDEGDYVMTVRTPDGTLPEGWWEVVWRVDVLDADGDYHGESYMGHYNTTMVFHYHDGTDEWELERYHDLVTDFSCTGCTGGPCKPKPKPKNDDDKDSKGKDTKGKSDKGPLKGDGKKKGKGKRDLHDTDGSTGSSSGWSNSTGYGPRAVNLAVDMFSQDSEGWKNVNFVGAHWYIADSSLTDLFDDGSLCEGYSGTCKICLGDGSYIFRVTGPLRNETQKEIWYDMLNITSDHPDRYDLINDFRFKSWQFCNTRGSYGDQLKFHVKKGKCYPDDIRWVDEICDSTVNSTVTLNGVIALSGINTEFFSTSDASSVVSALATQVSGWSAETMSVLSTSLDVRYLGASKRSAASFTHDVMFSVSFFAESYGVDGTNFGAVENLVDDMALTLQNSISSGVFGAELLGQARLMHSEVLEEVNAAELLSLEIASISYSDSHLVYYYNENSGEAFAASQAQSAAGLSTGVIVMFVIVAAAGFVAFVGIVSHSFNGYSKLPLESQHIPDLSEDKVPLAGSSVRVSRTIPRVQI